MSSEKDELVSQSEHQVDAYHAKGGDFSVKSVAAGHGQSGGHGTAEGKDQLAKAQIGPRNLEDDGDLTPSVWGKGGKAFSVGKTPSEGTSLSIPESVNLESGKIEVKGAGVTRVKEVPERTVKIGRK